MDTCSKVRAADAAPLRPVSLGAHEPFLRFFPGVTPQTQLRGADGDRRLYNPLRDIAYLGDHLLMSALQRLAEDKELHSIARAIRVTDTQVADAMTRYFRFTDTAALNDAAKLPTFDEHVKNTGIQDIDEMTRMYVTSVIGELTLMGIFQGKRSVSSYDHNGVKVDGTPDSEELWQTLERMCRRASRPLSWRNRLKAIWKLIIKGR